jgi:hypothetical protein
MESYSHFTIFNRFVKKGNRKLSIYIDYRGLNMITSRDYYPIPYIDNLLDKVYRLYYFTKMDLSLEYYQSYIYLNNQHNTAFIILDGLLK